MRITPLDVRKQEFNKSMRGFDCDEVQAFLHTLADEYEAVLIDNKQIRERVMEQDVKINEYTDLEKTLRDTLMTAERVMQDTRETASQKGELIIQEAEFKAKSILEECRVRTEELRREIVSLRKEKETYLGRFRNLAQAQIQFIDTHESDFEDLDKRLLDIVDNVAVKVQAEKTSNNVKSTPAPVTAFKVPATTPTFAAADSPTVAPTPTPAPVSSETDVWRDYSPNAETGVDSPDSSEVSPETSSDVAASFSDDSQSSEKPSHENDGKIADLVAETFTESGSEKAAETEDFITSDVVKVSTEEEPTYDPLTV